MSCGCLKVPMRTDSERKKSTAVARKLAEAEKRTYVIYERENETFTDSLAGWEKDGRPGALDTIILP